MFACVQTLHIELALQVRLHMAVFEGSTHYSLVSETIALSHPAWGLRDGRGSPALSPWICQYSAWRCRLGHQRRCACERCCCCCCGAGGRMAGTAATGADALGEAGYVAVADFGVLTVGACPWLARCALTGPLPPSLLTAHELPSPAPARPRARPPDCPPASPAWPACLQC